MKIDNNTISNFLSTNPSIADILKFVEDSAQARVKEIKAAGQGELC